MTVSEVSASSVSGSSLSSSSDGEPIGSPYLLDTESRDAVDSFMAADPYVSAGVLASVTVTRWRKGFFDHERLAARVDGELTP